MYIYKYTCNICNIVYRIPGIASVALCDRLTTAAVYARAPAVRIAVKS